MLKPNLFEVQIIDKIKEKYEVDLLSEEIETQFWYDEINHDQDNRITYSGDIFTINQKANLSTDYEFSYTRNYEGVIIELSVNESCSCPLS